MTAKTTARRKVTALVGALAAAVAMLALAAPALAAPALDVAMSHTPSSGIPAGGSGQYEITVSNSGDAATTDPITVNFSLPAGLQVASVTDETNQKYGVPAWSCSIAADSQSASCTGPDLFGPLSIGPGEEACVGAFGVTCRILVTVAADPGLQRGVVLTPTVTACGGGATTCPTVGASASDPTQIWLHFDVTSFAVTTSTNQAGAHPDITASFAFTTGADGHLTSHPKDIVVDLPPGFAGEAPSVPTCPIPLFQLSKPQCPADTQIGTESLVLELGPGFFEPLSVPVFNLPPEPGQAVRFGFQAIAFGVEAVVTVRPADNGLRTTIQNTSAVADMDSSSLTLWGVPADPSHDPQRGADWFCYFGSCSGGGAPAGFSPAPFESNPTQCTGAPLTATLSVNSWENPQQQQTATSDIGPITGCDRLSFDPTISVQPTTDRAAAPTGLSVDLKVPQNEDPNGLATPHLKKAVLTLPQGFTINPSAGAGLGVCTPAQYAAETVDSAPGAGCPNSSKIGDVTIDTPALKERATGSLFIAQPDDPATATPGAENPFDSLLALYVVARIPERGIIVKTAGQVTPDPLTGQLVTTFDNNPQLPFNDFTLSFRQGQRSPLISPPACGTYTASADLTPWSDPNTAVHDTSSFNITKGFDGGPCPSGGTPPFNPAVTAGTLNNNAGSFSPFNVRMTRTDGEQEITHFSAQLPPGLVGKLAGIPFCSDAQIALAKTKTGTEEQNNPSCPAASQVGHTLVGAGVGSVLAYAPGKVYLAGPYHGSPLSIAAITSATVGPFDLGTVVVRSAFKIDPQTAQVSVDSAGSDPIPHIIDGIPLHVRDIRVYMDRPNFTLNPTNCNPMSIASTLMGSGANFVSSADDVAATVTDPFQAADCSNLGFAPKLGLRLFGKTNRGAHPRLRAVLTMPKGGANIARAAVALPHSEFLDQGHIGTVCTRVQFAEGQVPGEKCPPGSIYGFAKAWSPLLDQPLQGPVYLRSSNHNLPDLVAALNGQIQIALDGRIDSVHGGIRNTFEVVPDAPVSKFILSMRGGRKGLLENSENLCAHTYRATAKFDAQNGKTEEIHPALKSSCGRNAKKHHHRGKR